jgi:hypothetical protein
MSPGQTLDLPLLLAPLNQIFTVLLVVDYSNLEIISIPAFDKFIEPLDCLKERLLLCKLLGLIGQICANGEPMLDSTVEIDLVWLAPITENAF